MSKTLQMAINLKRDLCDNSRHVGGVSGSVWWCLRRGGIFPGPGPRDKSDLTLTTDHSHPRPGVNLRRRRRVLWLVIQHLFRSLVGHCLTLGPAYSHERGHPSSISYLQSFVWFFLSNLKIRKRYLILIFSCNANFLKVNICLLSCRVCMSVLCL